MTDQYLSTNINNPRIVRIEDSDYQITLDDSIIAASATLAPVGLTLPEARTIPGWRVCIKAMDVTAGAITVSGLGGQLIDGSPSVSLSATNDSVVLESIGNSWIVCGANPSATGGDTCLTTFLVAPDPLLAPFTSIQAAYDAAVTAGADADNPAKILVCPGTYQEDVTMSVGGIDIVAVAIHRENQLASVNPGQSGQPGPTLLMGQLAIDLSVAPAAGVLNRCQWIGIDIQPNKEAPVLPLVRFTGATEQYATVSDSQISHGVNSATNIIVSDNANSLGNLVRVNCITDVPAPSGEPILEVVAGIVNANDCRLAGQPHGDGDFAVALTVAVGTTFRAAGSTIVGPHTIAGSVFCDRCNVLSTRLALSGDATFTRCQVSRILLGDWVTGVGSFTYDELTWSIPSQSNSTVGISITLLQRSSNPAGQQYLLIPFVLVFNITTQTNILADVSGGAKAIGFPSALSRPGPIRIKPTGGVGVLTITPSGADTIDGAAAPLVVPAAGLTLISDGTSAWQTWA